MQRDRLLLAEIIDSIERIVELTAGRASSEIDLDRNRRDALLWNFTVLGEAIGQVSDETKRNDPDVDWAARPHAEPDRPRLLVDRHRRAGLDRERRPPEDSWRPSARSNHR